MSQNDLLPLAAAGGGGLLLGALFQLALWWTVTRGLSTRRSPLLFPCSMVVRVGAAVVGFYLIGAGRWERLVSCLLGFVAAQVLLTCIATFSTPQKQRARSFGHAP
ncbi:MAG TPA: ATP synthase subunit I [Steroidobacteraceae bacterium]|nr:ATP synthase subunit I [Steroidobacteraceae bacterium]